MPIPPRGADPALLRRINAVNTLRVLYPGAPMTLTKIVEATGLARRTVEAAVDGLGARGLAVELPPAGPERSVGRPARSFRFRAEAGHVLGLDIGVHQVTALLADLCGDDDAKWRECAETVNTALATSGVLDLAGAGSGAREPGTATGSTSSDARLRRIHPFHRSANRFTPTSAIAASTASVPVTFAR